MLQVVVPTTLVVPNAQVTLLEVLLKNMNIQQQMEMNMVKMTKSE